MTRACNAKIFPPRQQRRSIISERNYASGTKTQELESWKNSTRDSRVRARSRDRRTGSRGY